MGQGLNVVFFANGQIKTDGEVRVAVESYLDKKGILAFEVNFCNFFSTGVTSLKQAKLLANSAQWQYKMPIEDLRQICQKKRVQISLSSTDSGWRAELNDSQTGNSVIRAEKDLELAVTLALTELESLLERDKRLGKMKVVHTKSRYFS